MTSFVLLHWFTSALLLIVIFIFIHNVFADFTDFRYCWVDLVAFDVIYCFLLCVYVVVIHRYPLLSQVSM